MVYRYPDRAGVQLPGENPVLLLLLVGAQITCDLPDHPWDEVLSAACRSILPLDSQRTVWHQCVILPADSEHRREL